MKESNVIENDCIQECCEGRDHMDIQNENLGHSGMKTCMWAVGSARPKVETNSQREKGKKKPNTLCA